MKKNSLGNMKKKRKKHMCDSLDAEQKQQLKIEDNQREKQNVITLMLMQK